MINKNVYMYTHPSPLPSDISEEAWACTVGTAVARDLQPEVSACIFYTHIYIHVFIHSYIFMYTYIYIYIYIYI